MTYMRSRSPFVPLSLLILVLANASAVIADATPAPQQSAAPSATVSQTESQATPAAAQCQRCGDGYCARSCENERTCPADCAPQTAVTAARCGKCGDGQCVRQCGETPESCPADCGYSSESATRNANVPNCEADKPAADAPSSKKD